MRILFLVATVSAIAWARPETYRETEDFQYSRSSSDEGSKSGYYGAQRGNMAGNYEKAHNMDSLAQHQMSGAVSQVEGELGDASKTRAGSVYTAANSRGVYGSGRYDLSNLQGRNFGESSSVDSSHSSLSSAFNQQAHNSDWRSQAQRTGYDASSQLGQSSLQNAAGVSGYDASNYGRRSSSGYHAASGYHTQSAYNSMNNYDQSNLNHHASTGYGTQAGDQAGRYTIVTPVRLVGRPGTQIAIPVYGQAYDSRRASSLYDQSSSNSHTSQSASSVFDQNAINSEAEVLNNNQQHISSVPTVPVSGDAKHYSSSYNYRKAWERRSETTELPVAVVPTVSPLPKHSELYEDTQSASGSDHLQQANSHNSYTGSAYNSANRYNSYAQSGSSQARQQSDYSSLHSSAANANSNAYTQGTYGSHAGLTPYVDSQPKSYQSSYSYHKSWEKQGDPYVIVPPTNGEASQRIVSGVKNHASAQHHGSQSNQHYSQGSAVDCDSLCRYRRAAPSYSTRDYYQQNQEDLGQQAQTGWGNLEQQTQQQSDNLEDLGQQTQQSWGDLQQQSNPQKLEDLGQQAQNTWGNSEQHQKLENLGQQTQQSWDNIHDQVRPEKLEDLGQQTQQSWDNIHDQVRPEKLEDLGQQTQQSWDNIHDQVRPEKLEDLGQQTQQSWDNFQQQSQPQKLEDLGQQTQQSWDNFQQQSQPQKLEDLGQQTQQSWGNQKLEDFGQRTQGKLHESDQSLEDLGQQTQQSWDKSNIDQQVSGQNLEDLGQQTQGQWDKIENSNQQLQHTFDNLGQQTQSKWDLDSLGQQTQQTWKDLGNITPQHKLPKTEDLGQQTQTNWYTEDLGQQVQTQWNSMNTVNKTRHTGTTNTEQTQFEQGDNSKNSNLDNPDNPAFWSLTDEQKHENNYHYSQHHSNNNYNSYSNSQTHRGSSWQEQTNNNNNNPLQSLWDKIDNMEQQSEHSSNENQQHAGYEISQHSYNGQENTYHHESNWEHEHSSYNRSQHETTYPSYQPSIVFNSTVDKPKGDKQPQGVIKNPKDDDLPEKPEPAEIGRGDIGAEGDLPTDVTTPKTESITQTYTAQIKPEKSPEEIEALSLSRGAEEVTNKSDSLNVLSLSQQKWLEEQRIRTTNELNQDHISGSKPRPTITTTTPRLVINEQHSPNYDQQSTGQEFEDSAQQSQHTSQMFQNVGQQTQSFDQQSTGQDLVDFGQQSQDLSQQHVQQLENFAQQNLDQQQTGQELVDFGQQSQDLSHKSLHEFENLGQHSPSFEQQNTGQQLEDFGQQSQDLSQRNLHQFESFGHQSQQNTGQQLEDFGQQSQDLSQQNLQQFESFEHQSQQNTGQQLEDFGQQSQDLTQENLKYENLGLHSQNVDQHQAREFVPSSNEQQIQEQKITPVNKADSQTHPKDDVEVVPPLVTTTEKPGFWKSVGNKFVSAKDTVSSWFKRS